MHPNWRALATLHIPLKRFVTEGTTEEPSSSSHSRRHKITNVTASEVKEFYEGIIQTPETAQKRHSPSQECINREEPKKVPFDKNKFFRAAMGNDIETIRLFDYQGDDLDSTDSYGWTGLMMAACEGSARAVETLQDLGADVSYSDRSGNTAFSLAQKKGFIHILELLSRHQEQEPESEPEEDEDVVHREFFCETCKRSFHETSIRDHITSTVHQFNSKRDKQSTIGRFTIPPNNRGLKIMLKQGWNKESGLGPTNSGRLFPVKTVIRKERTGLGTQQNPARVTHFGAYDLKAIKHVPRPRAPNRNDIRREKHREWKRERRLRRELE